MTGEEKEILRAACKIKAYCRKLNESNLTLQEACALCILSRQDGLCEVSTHYVSGPQDWNTESLIPKPVTVADDLEELTTAALEDIKEYQEYMKANW